MKKATKEELLILKIKDGYEPDGYLISGDFHDLFILGKDSGLHCKIAL